MALRAEDDNSNSPLPGRNYFWQDAEKPPSYDWEQWVQLFEVAVLARHSISMTELLREVDEQNPRIAAMMGNLEEVPAKRKLVSLWYISIGKTGRKNVDGQIPKHQYSTNRATILGAKLHGMLSNTQKSNIGSTHFFVKKAKIHGNVPPVLERAKWTRSPLRFRKPNGRART